MLSLDVRKRMKITGAFGRKAAELIQQEALEWSYEAVDRGAGEVMVTSIDRDGTGQGLDLA